MLVSPADPALPSSRVHPKLFCTLSAGSVGGGVGTPTCTRRSTVMLRPIVVSSTDGNSGRISAGACPVFSRSRIEGVGDDGPGELDGASSMPAAHSLTYRVFVTDPTRVEHVSGVAARDGGIAGEVDVIVGSVATAPGLG